MKFDEELEALIDAAMIDGVLTEKERKVLCKKAQSLGLDVDEFEIMLDARLVQNSYHDLGVVRRCPNCGTAIGGFRMTCPKCGYEFSNVGVNSYVEQFSKKLNELPERIDFGSPHLYMQLFDFYGIYEQKRRAEILEAAETRFIKNYPLPITREDCVEMLNYMLPKISLSGSNGATFAWRKKYAAILQKLELEAKGNPKVLDIVQSYRKQGSTNIFASFIIWYKSLSRLARTMFWTISFLVIVYGFGGLFLYRYLI